MASFDAAQSGRKAGYRRAVEQGRHHPVEAAAMQAFIEGPL
ncbi:hypothetical protein [Xanthomonas maliensis]|nr:hypothetical protein [Xanthomonas maliensis]